MSRFAFFCLSIFLLKSLLYASASDPASDKNWRTVWYSQKDKPLRYTLAFKKKRKVYGFVYIPNPYQNIGRIRSYRISGKIEGKWFWLTPKSNFKTPAQASFWGDKNEKFETIYFDKPIVVKALRLHSFKEVADRPVMTIAEFQPIFSKKKIPYKNTSLAELKHTRMAPSIHMNYGSPKAQAYYTEMSIKQSTAGSFFMTLGFDSGYFGLQEQKNGRKVVIFSVWDKFRGDDPKSVPDEKKVKVLYQNPDMARVGRFGGEGTGGQSFFEYAWQKGVKYRFYLSMKANGERNEYTAHFYLPEKKEWMKLVTFSTIAESAHLSRLHHFVEDFRRDFQSSKEVREAVYSNTYYRDEKGEWKIPNQVRFTKDSNSQMNIDCLVNAETRHLITGGKTANVNVPLWHSTKIAPTRNNSVLTDLPVEK